jgi:hypothetical protein
MDPIDAFLLVFMLCFFIVFFFGCIWLVLADHHRRSRNNRHIYMKQSDVDLERKKQKQGIKSGSAGNYFTYTSKPNMGVMLPRPEYSGLYIPLQ